MKKLLLTFSLAAAMLAASAQKVVITGAMFDPQGADAPAVGTINGDYTNKGGYEYIQLMATEDITFSPTNAICVVRCVNSGATTGAPANGWAETNSTRTFMFKVTSGTVAKGEFFYVGGPEKTAGGFLVDAGTYYPVLDMSSSKWLRIIPYSNGTTTAVGDDNIGIGNTGLFVNSTQNAAANPQGIAVFEGSSINVNSVPIDVIFTGWINPITSTGSVYSGASVPANNYAVCTTDRYTAGYYADGGGDDGNKYAFLFQPSTTAVQDNRANFLKLSGVFDVGTHTWVTKRTANYVQLCPLAAYGNAAARTGFATLAMIEGNAIGAASGEVPVEATKVINTLPVSLTSFTAKANKAGKVDLAWATASEQNNSHFEVNRSTDGSNFNKIGEVKGNGTTATLNNYNHTDAKPVLGTNYYQLKQVDFDGKSALSGVVPVKVSLSQNDLKASVAANRASVSINYNAAASGKATFTVYSVSGAKLATVQQSVNAGSNQLSIPVQLGNSLHLLKVEQGGESVSVKF